MIENNTPNIILATYAGVIVAFILGLNIGRYFQSSFLFRLIAVITSFSLMLIFISLKMQSSWFVQHPFAAFAISAYSVVLGLRLLELSFAYSWSYVQKMSLKLLVIYFLAFPRMPDSEDELTNLTNQDTNRQSMISAIRGISQILICQVLLYFTPLDWLTEPSVSFPSGLRFIRDGLLSIFLYLYIDGATSFGFGFYSYLTKIPMCPAFPSFPFISTSLRDFWSYRWNNLIKSSLHLMSFVIIPKFLEPFVSIPKPIKGLFAFAISGFIHEYALRFLSDTWSGKNMLFFLLHGGFMIFELTMKFPARPKSLYGKFFGWMWTLGVFLLTSSLFFDPMIERGIFASMKYDFDPMISFSQSVKSEM